ncbi:hypothetical protein V1523DRAFT_191581 [Lipomyces doorenjongii]
MRDSLSNDASSAEKKTATTSTVQLHDRVAIIGRITGSDDMADILAEDGDFIIDKATMDAVEALEVLRDALNYHGDDINFPVKTLRRIEALLNGVD